MLEGHCLCGKVRYKIDGPLGGVRYCHCSLCRHANGTAFSANSSLMRKNFTLTSGEDLISEYESSPGAFRCFCSNCGSPVFSRVESEPEHIRIRLGSLEGEPEVKIESHVWVGSKSSWFEITDDLQQHEEAAGPLDIGGT